MTIFWIKVVSVLLDKNVTRCSQKTWRKPATERFSDSTTISGKRLRFSANKTTLFFSRSAVIITSLLWSKWLHIKQEAAKNQKNPQKHLKGYPPKSNIKSRHLILKEGSEIPPLRSECLHFLFKKTFSTPRHLIWTRSYTETRRRGFQMGVQSQAATMLSLLSRHDSWSQVMSHTGLSADLLHSCRTFSLMHRTSWEKKEKHLRYVHLIEKKKKKRQTSD